MTFTQQERAVGHGRAANATGVGSSVRRTHLQLVLVGRAAERAARHHIRRIRLAGSSDCCETTWPKKKARSKAPRASQARPRSVAAAPSASSDRACPVCGCGLVGDWGERPDHTPTRNPPRTRVRVRHVALVRDLVSAEWFELMQVACRGPGRANAPTIRMHTQHHSRTLESVHRGRHRLAPPSLPT